MKFIGHSIMKILIVDDNSYVRRLLRAMFASEGWEFSEAADGVEAVEQYGKQAPDVVLMDIRMPNSDGIEATRTIKNAWPGASVLIVTEYDDPSLRTRARAAGAEEYFVKDSLDALIGYVKKSWMEGKYEGAQRHRLT
jgi:CheY-like chemotaxis protein